MKLFIRDIILSGYNLKIFKQRRKARRIKGNAIIDNVLEISNCIFKLTNKNLSVEDEIITTIKYDLAKVKLHAIISCPLPVKDLVKGFKVPPIKKTDLNDNIKFTEEFIKTMNDGLDSGKVEIKLDK